MWLCVFDPADVGKVRTAFDNWPDSHWEFDFLRHGSPLLTRDVLLVSGGDESNDSRFPLFKGLESADLVMFWFDGPNPSGFGDGVHYTELSDIPVNLQNARAEDAVLAIELTTQNPDNSNAVQRMGRVEDHTALQIPFLYVSPADSIRLKTGAGIEGSHGDERLIPFQRRLIKKNLPTDKDNLAGHVIGGCPFDEKEHPPQNISGWTEQCIRIHGDSYQVPAAHLTLPTMWSCIHDSYRYSGSQLSDLFDFMKEIMSVAEKRGAKAAREEWTIWKPYIIKTEQRVENIRNRGQRHPLLNEYGLTHGFPKGAIITNDKKNNMFDWHSRSEPHHLESRAKSMTLVGGRLEGNSREIENYCEGFRVDTKILSKIMDAVGKRYLFLSHKLRSPYDLSKDTYVGGMHIMDWCFTRKPAEHWDANEYPKAVSASPQDRLHIYALEFKNGRDSSKEVLDHLTGVYGLRTKNRMDLYRCEDGIFLGQTLADLTDLPFFTPLAV